MFPLTTFIKVIISLEPSWFVVDNRKFGTAAAEPVCDVDLIFTLRFGQAFPVLPNHAEHHHQHHPRPPHHLHPWKGGEEKYSKQAIFKRERTAFYEGSL